MVLNTWQRPFQQTAILLAMATTVVLGLQDLEVNFNIPIGESYHSHVDQFLGEWYTRMSSPVECTHLSIEGSGLMRVSWLNPMPFNGSIFSPKCIYGTASDSLNQTVDGNSYTYKAGMFVMTLNSAILDLNMFPSIFAPVFYQCGDPKFGMGPVRKFTMQSPKTSESSKADSMFNTETNSDSNTENGLIAIVGDMGVIKDVHTIASLEPRVRKGEIQLLAHAGDISYANNFGKDTLNNSYIWVEYMRGIENITSRVPYMVAPGNHERQFEFAAYLNWFSMPHKQSNSSSPFWYSFDYLGVHLLSYSTEHDFSQGSDQYKWMEADLKKANENRENVPWVMVMGHRPLYCTDLVVYTRCWAEAPKYRSYLEKLLYEQKVDVHMSGHNHQYERSWPVYLKKPTQKNYDNPQAPVYIVNGAAGCPERIDPTFVPGIKWHAFGVPTFNTGYLLLKVSPTKLDFQYIESKKDTAIDSFTITKS